MSGRNGRGGLRIELTPSELDAVEEAAADAHMDAKAYARLMVLAAAGMGAPLQHLERAIDASADVDRATVPIGHVVERCGRCDGTGRQKLRKADRQTLAALPVYPAAVMASAVARRLDIEPTAACNRLARLRRLGMVVRDDSPVGKGYVWSRPTEPPP